MENNLQQTRTPAVCRTCLNEIKDGCEFSLSDVSESNIIRTTRTFREKLISLLPEINLKIVHNAVICITCAASIESAYKFRKKCLKTEGTIQHVAEKINCTSTFDLRQILQHNVNIKPEDIEVVEEIKKEQMDITLFDVFKKECLINRPIEEVNCSTMHKDFKQEPQFETVHVNSVLFEGNSPIILEDDNDNHKTNEEGTKSYQQNKFETYECSNGSGEDEEYPKFLTEPLSNTIHRENQLINNSQELTGTLEKPFKCTQCKFSARLKRNLKNHVLRMHVKDGLIRQFKCSLCDYKTACKHHLTNHVRTHTGEKPYKCTECDYSTSQSTHLNTHMRIHSGDKPYKCTECDYSSSQKSHLNVHMRNHLGTKPYKCCICSYSGTTRSSVNIHMRIHTGEKPYECMQCDYRAAQQSSLQSHMKLHNTVNYFYNCNDCNYKTVYRNSLVVHMKTHKKFNS